MFQSQTIAWLLLQGKSTARGPYQEGISFLIMTFYLDWERLNWWQFISFPSCLQIPAMNHQWPKSIRKPTTSTVHPQSPKTGRKLTTSTVQGAKPPPQRPCVKSSGSKHVAEKIKQTPNTSLISVHAITSLENRSPNIQHWYAKHKYFSCI